MNRVRDVVQTLLRRIRAVAPRVARCTVLPVHAVMIACAGGLLAASPAGARAQSRGGWVPAARDSLVVRAIERRGMQLADSTLLSFEANAHGFLAFVAQLGEGRLIPPRVVQSEELVSRLYWWQPSRSAQRLIGRRDTTLLPARVGYYRDRYQVVLDNLPDLIRLGDGQDVRDVPHPLSPSASSVYEFRRGGQVRIRIPGREILVDEIRFRPIDDTKPAAVGSVYLDRESAAVVRLSMAFTRAAIIDKRIETLVLTLENALIHERYWLPRRQEVEVSRRATWFEIPARGIVRAHWEVSDYVVNERFPDGTTQLPRWSSASRDSLESYPFEARIVDVLPQDIQLATDEELAAARAQVESAVRAAALARPARAAFTGRGISDFARYTRTEGLAMGLGVARRVGGVRVAARARYGFADREVKGQLALGLVPGLGGEPNAQLFVEREYRDVAPPERAGVTNSAAALLFGSDYTTRVDTRAAGVSLRGNGSPWQLRLAWEDDRALPLVAEPATGRFEPTLPFWSMQGGRAELRGTGGWVPGVRATTGLWGLTLASGAYTGSDHNGNAIRPLALRMSGTLSLERAMGDDRTFFSMTQATLAAGRELPPQWLAFAGGPWSAPGYGFHEFRARALLSERLEMRLRVPAPSIGLGRYGRSPPHVTLAPFVQALAVHGAAALPVEQVHVPGPLPRVDRPLHVDGVYPSVGLGVLFFYDLVRADVARGLRNGTWRFSIDIDRSFWGIL